MGHVPDYPVYLLALHKSMAISQLLVLVQEVVKGLSSFS
jgi:hypothetical protein